jgi:hypothetical protein
MTSIVHDSSEIARIFEADTLADANQGVLGYDFDTLHNTVTTNATNILDSED